MINNNQLVQINNIEYNDIFNGYIISGFPEQFSQISHFIFLLKCKCWYIFTSYHCHKINKIINFNLQEKNLIYNSSITNHTWYQLSQTVTVLFEIFKVWVQSSAFKLKLFITVIV